MTKGDGRDSLPGWHTAEYLMKFSYVVDERFYLY